MRQTRHRIERIDILRGMGILIMIMGHVGFGGKFDHFIHTFHMPLFFFISGYCFVMKPEQSFAKRIALKAKALLLPYCIYGIINYFAWLVLERNENNYFKPIINLFTYNTHGLPIAGALWFLTALFWADIMYSMLVILCKQRKYLLDILSISISISMAAITTFTSFRLPLTMDISCVAIGFIHIGKRYREFEEKGRFDWLFNSLPKQILAIGVLLAVNLVICLFNGYVNMKEGWYAIVPLSFLNAFIGSFALYIFARIIDEKALKIFKNGFAFIGKNSLVFLCINQLVILLCVAIIGEPMGYGDFNLYRLLNSSLVLILSIAMMIGVTLVINLVKNFQGKVR